jgi:hypothetical protein
VIIICHEEAKDKPEVFRALTGFDRVEFEEEFTTFEPAK